MSKILIHLISGQTMPVYIASEIVKPDINACLVSQDARKQYEYIKNASETDIDEIEVEAFDYMDVYGKLEAYIEKYCDKENDEIIFNFTGGTKIQSAAVFEYAMKNGFKAMYLNTQNSESMFFENYELIKKNTYTVKIPPKKFFALNGYADVIMTVFDEVKKFPEAEEFLNVMKNNYKNLAPVFSRKKRNRLPGTLKLTKRNVKVQLQKDGNDIFFFNKNKPTKQQLAFYNRLFSAGYWLEYLTFETVKKIGKFDYVVANLKIPYTGIKEDIESKNEIDVMAMSGVVPYVFECKTGSIKQTEINKLNYLKRMYFGRYSKLIFVGLSKPSTTSMEKLKDANIDFVLFEDLENYLMNISYNENANLK